MPIEGLTGHPTRRVSLSDLRLEFGPLPGKPALPEIPELESSHLDATDFGTLPAFGIWARHVEVLTLRGARVTSKSPDARPPLVFDDVRGLDAAPRF